MPQQHTRFSTLNRQVTVVMNDIGKILFTRSMRNETRNLNGNPEAVCDLSVKISDQLDHVD